jgi:hypothetical protein
MKQLGNRSERLSYVAGFNLAPPWILLYPNFTQEKRSGAWILYIAIASTGPTLTKPSLYTRQGMMQAENYSEAAQEAVSDSCMYGIEETPAMSFWWHHLSHKKSVKCSLDPTSINLFFLTFHLMKKPQDERGRILRSISSDSARLHCRWLPLHVAWFKR